MKSLATLWSRQFFPGAGEGRREWPPALAVGLLMLAAAALFFGQLDCPLQEPQESRYAEIARQMDGVDSWVIPLLHGQAYYDKPPLFYWLLMGSYRLFGVHDWSARLVPASAGFLCVLITYWWGQRTVGARTALLGAGILCLSPRFIQMGRMVLMDSPLCLCVTAAWATGHVALMRSSRRLWLLSAVSCGLGILVKGPVALVLALGPLLAYRLLFSGRPRAGAMSITRTAPPPSGWCFLTYAAIALGVAAPWFVLVALRDPDFLSYFFWFHHVERFVTPFDHQEPFWYYLPVLLLGMLPWSLALPVLFRLLTSRSKRMAVRRPAGLGFFLLTFVISFGFFSAAGCKRPAYILLTMPPLALTLGVAIQAHLPRKLGVAALWRQPSVLAYRLALAALLMGGAGAIGCAFSGLIDWPAGFALAFLALVVLPVLLLARRPGGIPWALCGTTSFLVMLLTVQCVLPGYSERFAYRDLVHGQKVESDLPIVCYPRRYDSVSFYLQRNDVAECDDLDRLVRLLEAQPRTELFLRPGKACAVLMELQRRLPVTLRFEPQGREGSLMGGRVIRAAAE